MVARFALLAALFPLVAAAQAPTRQDAETCERQHRHTDNATTCGDLYLALYSADPTVADGDELLYNAGHSYADGRAIGAALQSFALLRRYYPNGKLAPRALAYSARLYIDTAMYDRAAELLEEYAKKYGGEKDAYSAMSDAIYYRKAIGDDDKAIWNTKSFVKLFGRKNPREAANAYFSLTAIYEKQRDRELVVKHLKDYIRQYGATGGDDRLVIAYAKIGEHVKAVKAYERVGGQTGGDEAGARYYYAQSKLALVDAEVTAKSAADEVATAQLVTKYEALMSVRDPATAIIAAARIGRVLEAHATAAPKAAKPSLRERTKLAYGVCLAKAVELSWFEDEGGRACERALIRLDPDAYPPLTERIGAPTRAASVLTVETLRR